MESPYRTPAAPWRPANGSRVEILPNDWSIAHQWAGRIGVANHKIGNLFTVQLDDGMVLHCHLRELAPLHGEAHEEHR